MRHGCVAGAMIATCLAAASPAHAAGPAEGGTTLFLTGSGRAQVTPDELVATLDAAVTGSDAAAVQRRVNAQLEAATREAGGVRGVTQRLLGYDMSQDDKQRWSATGRLALDGTDAPSLLELVGRLQSKGLALEGLDWQLTPALHDRALSEATRASIADLKRRAAEAADALGLHVVRIAEVHLSGGEPIGPRPLFAMRANAMAVSAPPAPSGTQEVTAEASATVLLAP